MCHNQPKTRFALAQPVVGAVSPPDDESDVTHVGTVPCVYLDSLVSNTHS